MNIKEMRTALNAVSAGYTPNPRYFDAEAIQGTVDSYLSLYRVFLKGWPLTRTIYRMEIEIGLEESRELAGRLTSPQAFIDEVVSVFSILEGMAVVFTKEPLPHWQQPEQQEAGRLCRGRSVRQSSTGWKDLPDDEKENWARLAALSALANKISRSTNGDETTLR